MESLPKGAEIGDRYVISRQLASSGIASVFEAEDKQTRRTVAIKLLPQPEGGNDPQALFERFEREAQVLARLDHRHIIRVLDYGSSESGSLYLVMAWCSEGSLAKVPHYELLKIPRVLTVAMQVCDALHYAHEQGVVHRNVKAANIFVDKDEEGDVAKLVDFGMAKYAGQVSLTVQGVMLGNVDTMSPEQIKARPVDGRTDIYSLGAVIFRMITGEYPFTSRDPITILSLHLSATPPSFGDVRPQVRVPPDLERIVQKCLTKDRDERYASVELLKQDLAACLEVSEEDYVTCEPDEVPTQEVAAQLQASPSQAPPPWVWAVTGVAAVVLIAVGAFLAGVILG